MKHKSIVPVILIPMFVAVLLYGCATRVITPGTTYHPAVTNADGTITPEVPATAPTTNYVPNKTGTAIVNTAGQVVQYVPDPWKTPIEGGLGLATAIMAFLARRANGQAKDASAVVATVVQGVEAAGKLADAVKESIATKALANGTADAVHAAVQEHTAPT